LHFERIIVKNQLILRAFIDARCRIRMHDNELKLPLATPA
jgi:hypothetical protein